MALASSLVRGHRLPWGFPRFSRNGGGRGGDAERPLKSGALLASTGAAARAFADEAGRAYSPLMGQESPVVCHISQSDPFCPDLRQTIIKDLNNLQFKFHPNGTYICIEGPRFSTKAESNYYRSLLKADIIGMTLIPECIFTVEKWRCVMCPYLQ